ncbi:aminotransferase class IV [Myxococcota bacterium]|nr:aminotransferase class IV [Myxococcota bacterium]
MQHLIQDGQERADGLVRLDPEDPGLLRGLSAFETLRTWGEGLPTLALHLARLRDSAAALGLPAPPLDLLADEAHRAVAALQGAGEPVRLRITLTPRTRLVRAATGLPPTGLARACTRPWPGTGGLSGRVKHGSRAAAAVALQRADADELVWVDERGAAVEGSWSNVLAVRGGRLFTPPDDGRLLPGVTRGLLLRQARALGVPTLEVPLPVAGPWDELYLSSSLRLLVPVASLDGAPAAGEGPVGAAVSSALRAGLEAGRLPPP